MLHLAYASLYAIVVARRLTIEEFGLWATIVSLDTLVSSIVYFWSWLNVRFYARGVKDYVESSFTVTTIYSIVAPLIMLSLGLTISRTIGWGFVFFIYGSILVIFDSFYVFFRDVALSIQPYYVGYVNMVRDTIRLFSSYLAVYVFNAGLRGALLSLVFSSITADSLFLAVLSKHGVKLRLSLKYVGIIFRNIYIPAVNSMYNIVASSEKPLVTVLTSSTDLTAYINVASISKTVIIHGGGVFTQSLLPKLLSQPSSRDVEDVLKIGFLVNTGLSVFMLLFSNAILSLYGCNYVEAKTLYYIYVIDSLVFTHAVILSSIPIGMERRDLEEAGFKLIKTHLFKIPFAQFVRSLIAVTIGSVGLALSLKTSLSGLTPLMFYPIGWLITDSSFLIFIHRVASRCMAMKIPWKELFVTALASIVSSSITVFFGLHNVVLHRISRDVFKLIVPTVVFASVYLSVCVALSSYYREIACRFLKKLKILNSPVRSPAGRAF